MKKRSEENVSVNVTPEFKIEKWIKENVYVNVTQMSLE
jgi:hypothetical protein